RQELIVDFKNNFSRSTAGILIASLLGNRYFLDKQTADIFREGGTFHVLVISGLHITFIGGLTLLFIKFFTRKRFWQFVIASAFLWAYSFAVGADVPVVRATIMFTILLFSQVIYRKGNLLNSLGACALVLLVWRPEDLFSQSFHLTFLSVTSIVAFAFPLIEKLREIGDWSPSVEKPFPPQTSRFLKRFCEMLYWRERVWEIEVGRQIWSANLFKSPYLKWLDAKNIQGIFKYIFEAFLVSFIVQIWLLPLTVFYFHRVTFSSIFLNLWVGVFIALESFAAVFALLLAEFSHVLALPIIKLTEMLNWFLLFLPKIFIAFDAAGFRVPVYSGAFRAIYFLYYIPVLMLTILLNRWRPFEPGPKTKFQIPNSKFNISNYFSNYFNDKILRRISAPVLFLFVALVVFHPFSAPKLDNRLHVEFIDVGQGDSALITFPNGETLLIDGGGKITFKELNEHENDFFQPDSQTIGESVVSQFLWEKGYSKIDYILATHADTDHIQGLIDVAKNFKVRAAFFGRMPYEDAGFAELYEVLKKKKIETITVSRGEEYEIGEVKIQILYPEKVDSPKPVADNNHSVVLRIVYGTKKFLFTGDIEKETEAKLLENPVFLKTDILKVAHHGSRTSSTTDFINAAKPEYAIIPVGRRSIFGHPHQEIVERFSSSGVKIKTTGERGTISVSTDSKDLQIETFQR
ncbi:MAG: ComEC/Rec2 family competence protein, partial [Pyrinomonadaceae bacterium]